VIVLPFSVSIPKERQDPGLPDKLKDELPGIFCWSLEGLVRLRERGRFVESSVSNTALVDYRGESNPTRAFLTETYVAKARHFSGKTTTQDVT
jgi:putative DNA primase/helicase